MNKTVGGIYRGVKTEDFKSFQNLESSMFISLIKEKDLIMAMQSSDFANKKAIATKAVEQKSKSGLFDKETLFLRSVYSSLRTQAERKAFLDLVTESVRG